MSSSAAEAKITGRVQGVGFRWFTMQRAKTHGVTGWVRNDPAGSVSVYAEGDRDTLEAFLDDLRSGPSSASVSNVDISWTEFTGQYHDFNIKH